MKFFGLGMPELIIILVVILIIFGPKNLPKLGSALGRTVKNVREGVEGSGLLETAELEDEEEEEDDEPVKPKSKKGTAKSTAAKKG
ncbi:MAG: twin-arginine translocase TatA/TatE family subunit [Coriobacteriales bacterium]|jgi:sec-independent protein translocase protein TatA|nr:twin-arginine translocase TatA/TatE family subunit [Coriobacteriales bacterium]